VVSSRDTRRIYRRFRVEIHHFPQVQILGNHAKIREGQHYIDLGVYNSDGTFEWSPEGVRRRAEILDAREIEERAGWEAAGPVEDALEKDKAAEEFAAAKLRNEARLKKQTRRGGR
jgi:hypothetical protein